MNCLLVAATVLEIGPFLEKIPATEREKMDLDVLITGVGLTATAYSLAAQLGSKRPALIIQAGIAGCFRQDIALGSVFGVARDVIADQGVFESGNWISTSDMGFTPADLPPYKDGWLVNRNTSNIQLNDYVLVDAVSVNQVSSSREMIGAINHKYSPVLESMEGAALHYTAILEDIPFMQIRSISNYVGERDKKKWDLKNAVINLNKELLHLLPTL